MRARMAAPAATPPQPRPPGPTLPSPAQAAAAATRNLSDESEDRQSNITTYTQRMRDVEQSLSDVTLSSSDDTYRSGTGPLEYHGSEGKKIPVTSNYLRLSMEEGKGVFEYEVTFDPQVDSRDQRFKLLSQQRDVIGINRSFDGTKLFLTFKLPNASTIGTGTTVAGESVKVKITFKSERKSGDQDVCQFYNILINRIFRALKFTQHKRNFYDASGKHEIKQHKLQVWPGYVTAVDFYEGGLLLQVDVHHRVLRTETVRDFLVELKRRGVTDIKSEAEKALLGESVLTRYNNKTYKIDDLDFQSSPKSTFTNAAGEEISYLDYYKNQYGIVIADQDQPLLLNRPKKNEQGTDRLISLIPELCLMTGLTDNMRADFRIMKEVGNYTRVSPQSRKIAMTNFVVRVMENEAAREILTNYGLKMSEDPIMLDGRLLPPEKIFFGGNYSEMVTAKADWGRAATSKRVLTPIRIHKWAIFYQEKNKTAVQEFCKLLQQNGPRMGIDIANPRPVSLENDRTETYLNKLRELIDPTTQLMMIIVPQIKSDRYAAIKKLCCIEKPVASQVIVAKTISNDKKLASVAQKVILQVNCKLGGELWACQSPFNDMMVIGIDVFHDKSRKSGSVAGLVATLNDPMTRYYSTVAIQKQGQEIVDALKVEFTNALVKYFEVNHKFPANIVIFRDGVGDGMLETTRMHEVMQFVSAFKHVSTRTITSGPMETLAKTLPKGYNPGFNFVVVQKRINTRIFTMQSGSGAFENPPPGTILDHTVTRYQFKDFFLIPQSVTQGTVSPTHFVVLRESGEKYLTADAVQRLAYRLSHMYYNWPGTVRVPAPCQYAHKLVDLVGENLHQVPSPELSTKLYYL